MTECRVTLFTVLLLVAQSVHGSDCVDTGLIGDGWGWDGQETCTLPVTQAAGECIDTPPANDGWGWNGVESCPVAVSERNCFDSDPIGDGWGWDGIESCVISAAPIAAECSDTFPFDDNWGWDGIASCTLSLPPATETQVISLTESGEGLNEDVADRNYLSDNGRYLVFTTRATNLLSSTTDNDGFNDVFRRDLTTGQVIKVSTPIDGQVNDSHSYVIDVSAGGRFVLFRSFSSAMVPAASGGVQMYLQNVQTGERQLVTRAADGTSVSLNGLEARLVADGSAIYFSTRTANLGVTTPLDTHYIYKYDVAEQVISFIDTGIPSGGSFKNVSDVTPNGTYILFSVSSDIANVSGTYITNTAQNITTKVTGSVQPYRTSITDDGRYVAYAENNTLVIIDALDGATRTFDGDTLLPTELPILYNAYSLLVDDISPDGRYVSYTVGTGGRTDFSRNLSIMDTTTGMKSLISKPLRSGFSSTISSFGKFIDNGRQIYFYSTASNLVPDDNYKADVLLAPNPLSQ